MNIDIRPAIIGDLESILKLNKALFDYETNFNTEYNLDWTYSEVGRSYFTRRIEEDKNIALVAEDNGEVVGYIVVTLYSQPFLKENPIAELENMFVDESYRGKGIGKRLVEKAKRLAKEKGAKRFKVEAAAQNEKAIKFYKSCGFEDFDVTLLQSL